MEAEWGVTIIDIFLFSGKVAYFYINLLPDIIKWVIIIFMFIPYFYWEFRDDILFAILWTISIPGIFIEYFKKEVNIPISDWIANIPNEIYSYVTINPFISGFTFIVVILIILGLLGFIDDLSDEELKKIDDKLFGSNEEEYVDYDSHKDGGYSPRELKDLKTADKIRDISRNLRR